nr:hypothetical protein [Tanacetum cinerariifolium]
MNLNYYDPNLCYSSGFDQYQPPQYSITHQPPQEKIEELLLEEKLPQALQTLYEKLNKYVQEKQEEKNISKEQAAKVSSQYWKPPIYYNDDDDDEEFSIQVSKFLKKPPIAITPVLPTIEPEDSLSMGDEHLSVISEKESNKVIKSSVENLVPIPSESKDLTDYEKELNSEILDAIIESFSPSPIPVEDSDSLMEEIDIFLALDDSIPSSMENDDYDSEGMLFFLKNCLKMILFPFLDDDVYFDIEPDMGILTVKVVDDISDNSTRELYVHVPNVLPTLPTLYPVFEILLPFSSKNEDKVFNTGILISKEEKSPHLLSHQSFKVFHLINDSKSSMMIYGFLISISILLDQIKYGGSNFEASRARGFVYHPLELQSLTYGNPIS